MAFRPRYIGMPPTDRHRPMNTKYRIPEGYRIPIAIVIAGLLIGLLSYLSEPKHELRPLEDRYLLDTQSGCVWFYWREGMKLAGCVD